MRFLWYILPVIVLLLITIFTTGASYPPPYSVENLQVGSLWEHIKERLGWEGWFALGIFVLTFASLIKEWIPPDITMLTSASIFVISGILTPTQFLEGFSNEIIMTIAMLCVIVRALEINGVLEIIAKRLLSQSKYFWMRMVSMVIPVGVGSAFLNNTPIVLLMAPIVRKWALDGGNSPSKFLIPLSYATILGGTCTIIGTSTNVIVYGLISKNPYVPDLGFFELAQVGLPLFIIGVVYLVFFSKYLLPDRMDTATTISEEINQFTAEFLVDKECPFVNQKINECAKYFNIDTLIQLERNSILVDSPGPDFTILLGDRLIFAGDVNQIAKIHTIPGLKSAADPHFKLDTKSSHFSEVVISTTSLLIGKTLRRVNFRTNYGASVFAVYRQGRRVVGTVADIVLQAGDTLMLISSEGWPAVRRSKDFYVLRPSQKLAIFHPIRSTWAIFVVLVMVVLATMGVSIMLAALTAALLLIVTGSITIREAQTSIMWNILLLIACSFAFGKGMEVTGVATALAEIMLFLVGSNPYFLIGGIFIVGMLATEFLTNNAAAIVFFPIGISMAALAGYTSPEAVKAVGVTIAIGCSCSFSIPTGYQTNMIVYGLGGYRFSDFARAGLPLNIIVFIIATLLIPQIWPLVRD